MSLQDQIIGEDGITTLELTPTLHSIYTKLLDAYPRVVRYEEFTSRAGRRSLGVNVTYLKRRLAAVGIVGAIATIRGIEYAWVPRQETSC